MKRKTQKRLSYLTALVVLSVILIMSAVSVCAASMHNQANDVNILPVAENNNAGGAEGALDSIGNDISGAADDAVSGIDSALGDDKNESGAAEGGNTSGNAESGIVGDKDKDSSAADGNDTKKDTTDNKDKDKDKDNDKNNDKVDNTDTSKKDNGMNIWAIVIAIAVVVIIIVLIFVFVPKKKN